jgi:microcystin-dependent protein
MAGEVERLMRFQWPAYSGEDTPNEKRTFLWDAALLQRALTDAIWRVGEQAITRDLIRDKSISLAKLAAAIQASLFIEDGAVTRAKLAAEAWSADATGRDKMANDYATGAKFDDGAVELRHLELATRTIFAAAKPVTGMMAFFAGEQAPRGWLECNGQQYDARDYPELYLYCSCRWPYTSSIVAFRVPECRGFFARGRDHGAGNDPDVTRRYMYNDDWEIPPVAGDAVGGYQTEDLKAHRHAVKGTSVIALPVPDYYFISSYQGDPLYWERTAPAGGAETRPKNVGLMVMIKT